MEFEHGCVIFAAVVLPVYWIWAWYKIAQIT